MIIVGDLHISADRTRYSVLKVKKTRESNFSPRLTHLCETIEWIDRVAGSRPVVQLGDIVSKARLDAEELTMIDKVAPITENWVSIRGNHGLGINGTDSDCAVRVRELIREVTYIDGRYNIVYLPYILEKDRKPLKEYLEGIDRSLQTVIFSHNDIKGMNYGGYVEKNGWSIEELEEWGDLIINGHIHNQQWLTDKILIAGNADGENLSEDYRKYPHGVWVFDEGAFIAKKSPKECVKFIPNPYAMKFANVEIKTEADIERIKAESDNRTVLAITVPERLADQAQELIDNHLAGGKKIVKVTQKRVTDTDNIERENHIDKFKRHAALEFGELEIIGEI